MRSYGPLICLLPLLLTGCALHSETREKQSVAARDAWKKVDLAGQLSAARKAEAQVLIDQLRTEEEIQRARRDALARAMSYGGTVKDKLLTPIEAELKKAIAPHGGRQPVDIAAEWLEKQDVQAKAIKGLEKYALEFRRAGLEMPACASVNDGSAAASVEAWIKAHPLYAEAIGATWLALGSECANPDLSVADKAELPPGALKTQLERMQAASRTLAAVRTASLNQRNAFRAAAKVHADELANIEKNPHAGAERLEKAKEKLEQAISAISKLDKVGADAFADKLLATARVESLNKLLSSPHLGNFVTLADDVKAAQANGDKARLAPLVVAKNLEGVKAAAAERDVALHLRREQLLQEQWKWQAAQLDALVKAHQFASKGAPGRDLAQLLRPQQMEGKEAQTKADAWKAASLYLDAEGRLKAEIRKIDYQLLALEHERALSYAESNIGQWNALISSVIDQQVEYGAAGVRPSDLAALANALALLWIGAGVN